MDLFIKYITCINIDNYNFLLGSPFLVNVGDVSNATVNWERLLQPLSAGTNVNLTLNPHGMADAQVEAHIRGTFS